MIGRRTLLAAGSGLLVTVALPRPGAAAEPGALLPGSLKETPGLDAWIAVTPSGVTAFTGKAELGQGLRTALIQIAAEQLCVFPSELTLVTADTALTPNEGITSGSHSMQDSGTALLHAAAQVRFLLTEAAAAEWGLPAGQLTARAGAIHAADGRTLPYTALAAKIDLHVHAQPQSPLVSPADYSLIGTPMPRVDIPAKVTGGPAFIQDMRPPGMLHARVVRQPTTGAVLQSIDTAAIERMPGVVRVLRDGSWLAVVARGEWQAIKAQRALAAAARWQDGPALPDPATILDTIKALPSREIPVMDVPGPASTPTGPGQRFAARYTRQYLMHAAIGPSCALAQMEGGQLTVWSHTQGVYPLRAAIASLLAMPPGQVRCTHVPGSGCYGHNGADDVAGDAALIARALPGPPIRVQWMREDENTAEPYSPAMIAEAAATLDADGAIADWDYAVWSNTHNRRPNVGGLMLQNAALATQLPVPPPAPIPMPEGGGDRNSNPIYALPKARVVYHFIPEMPLRVSAQRSLGAHVNVFAIESFMDELATAAGKDPAAFRLAHLADDRAKAVIQLAAEQYGWPGAKLPPGTGRGFAFARYKNLGAYCAIALDLSVERDTGQVRLGRIVAAVDSGQAINPDGIRNQIEGAIVQSASWTLHEQVGFDRRRITSSDWSGYPILRFPALPASVEVHIVPRPGQPFLGTGEAGQGPAAAAIANAIHHATGIRLRDLPLTAGKIKAAIGV